MVLFTGHPYFIFKHYKDHFPPNFKIFNDGEIRLLNFHVAKIFALRELLRGEHHIGGGVVVGHWIEHLMVGQVVVVDHRTKDLLVCEVVVVDKLLLGGDVVEGEVLGVGDHRRH